MSQQKTEDKRRDDIVACPNCRKISVYKRWEITSNPIGEFRVCPYCKQGYWEDDISIAKLPRVKDYAKGE